MKAMSWEPTSRSDVPSGRNMGWPKARERQGHGVMIVVVGVTSHQGEQESCSQGEARQVEYGQQPRGRCDAKSQTGADHHAPSHTGRRVSTGELLDTETVTSRSEEGG